MAPLVAELLRPRGSVMQAQTIGILGDWGTGKTRFLELLRHDLSQKGITTVWFNAWRYASEETLWLALLQRILDQIKIQGGLWQRLHARWRLLRLDVQLAAGFRNIGWAIAKLVVRLIAILCVLGIALSWTPIGSWIASKIAASPVAVPLQILTVVGALLALFAQKPEELLGLFGTRINIDLTRFMKRPTYRDKVAFLDEFSTYFREIVEIAGAGNPVVILLDDLDRCLPEKVVQLLEGIKLLLDVDGCIFVLAANRAAVEQAIRAKYKDFAPNDTALDGNRVPKSEVGAGYFDKIVQLPITLPPLTVEQFTTFLQGLTDDKSLAKCMPLLAQVLPRNARQAERYLAVVTFTAASLRQKKIPFVMPLLAKLVALRTLSTPLYERLTENPDLLGQIEPYVRPATRATIHESDRLEWDPLIAATPALQTLLQESITEDDHFTDTNLRPYIFFLAPLAASPGVAIPSLDPTLLSTYRSTFQRRFGRLLPLGASNPIPIHDALVPRQLVDAKSQEPIAGTLLDVLIVSPQVLVLGGPGAGKTTLLHAAGIAQLSTDDIVPVFLPLRGLAHIAPTDLVAALLEDLARLDLTIDAAVFREWLKNGRLTLLLDGLDEVPFPQRALVEEEIFRLASLYPRCRIVLASREEPRRGSTFRVLRLAPLNDKQRADLITRLLVTTTDTGQAAERAPNLLHLLQQSSLRALADSPLLLSMLVSVYSRLGVVGTTPEALARQWIDLMLEQWDQTRGVDVPVDAGVARALLQGIASHMHAHDQVTISELEVGEVAARLSTQTKSTTSNYREVLLYLLGRTGLLRELAAGRYQFTHDVLLDALATGGEPTGGRRLDPPTSADSEL